MRISGAWWWGAGLILLGTGAVAARTQQAAPEAPAAVVASPILDGPTAFRESGCGQCHEIRGVGGHKGPDLSGVGRRLKKQAIEDQIEHGGRAMPAFGDVLPNAQIAALVAYLKHCRDKEPHSPMHAPPEPTAASAD